MSFCLWIFFCSQGSNPVNLPFLFYFLQISFPTLFYFPLIFLSTINPFLLKSLCNFCLCFLHLQQAVLHKHHKIKFPHPTKPPFHLLLEPKSINDQLSNTNIKLVFRLFDTWLYSISWETPIRKILIQIKFMSSLIHPLICTNTKERRI